MRKGKVSVTVKKDGNRPARGQDARVSVEVDGEMVYLPCTNLALRIADRKAVATLELFVDEVEIDGVLLHKITAMDEELESL